jgi:flagellar biosynthesis protein FlhG
MTNANQLEATIEDSPTSKQGPLIVAVGGGKGGVGKTMIAANIGVAFARIGARVVAVDADLGSANLHALLGVGRSTLTLHSLLEGRVESLEEIVTATAVPRLFLVPGSDAIPGAANIPHAQKLKLIRHIRKLDTDVVVLDCGAGVGYNVIDFFNVADRRILVATAQLISLQNCYGFLKASLYRAMRDRAINQNETEWFKAACTSRETERTTELLNRLSQQDSSFASQIENVVSNYDVSILGNQLENPRELNAIHALTRMVSDFLSVKVPVIGGIMTDQKLNRAVSSRRPFLTDTIDTPTSRLLLSIASSYMATDVDQLRRRNSRSNRPEPDTSAGNGNEKPGATGPSLPRSLTPYKRAHERYSVDWPVQLRGPSGMVTGRILDISLGGARILWSGTANRDDELEVTFIAQSDRPTFPSRVMRAHDDTIGIVFIGDSAKDYLTPLLNKLSSSGAE